jgi:hypothetical protein
MSATPQIREFRTEADFGYPAWEPKPRLARFRFAVQ